jgi:site-specific DNA-methyltransferase (adenine-specific)
LSTELTEEQKENAYKALEEMLAKVQSGEVSDFRMVIKGQQRTTHSDSEKVSGRAKELHEKGFYFLKYNPKGSKPTDIWDIIPEDTQGRKAHFAPYPEDLCRTPIILTCPKDGIVLDPFVGTGTTCAVARELKRKSVGIDLSQEYLDIAQGRCNKYEYEQMSLSI